MRKVLLGVAAVFLLCTGFGVARLVTPAPPNPALDECIRNLSADIAHREPALAASAEFPDAVRRNCEKRHAH